jgi:hypothetical protein
MTDERDLSDADAAMATPASDKSAEDVGSRFEAAEAGLHHEAAEAAAGVAPREHVTAYERVPPDAAGVIAHHHPEDSNAGIVRGRPARGVVLAAVLTAAVTVAGVVLLALAVGGKS